MALRQLLVDASAHLPLIHSFKRDFIENSTTSLYKTNLASSRGRLRGAQAPQRYYASSLQLDRRESLRGTLQDPRQRGRKPDTNTGRFYKHWSEGKNHISQSCRNSTKCRKRINTCSVRRCSSNKTSLPLPSCTFAPNVESPVCSGQSVLHRKVKASAALQAGWNVFLPQQYVYSTDLKDVDPQQVRG
jgi:hypothetical protein